MVVLAQKGLGQFCLTSGQQRLSLTTEFGHYGRELSYWNRHASYGPGIPGWGGVFGWCCATPCCRCVQFNMPRAQIPGESGSLLELLSPGPDLSAY